MTSLITIFLTSVLAASSVGQLSPTSDLSGNRVKVTGGSTARSLRDRFADVVNVRDFGATGNGTTDDTAAWNAALAALPAAGGTVVAKGAFVIGALTYPSGPVRIELDGGLLPAVGSTVTITIPNHVVLFGKTGTNPTQFG